MGEETEHLEDDVQEEPKPKPKPVLVAVRVINAKGGSALVEWQGEGRVRRSFVPAADVRGGTVEQSVLEAAPEYGEPWEEIIAAALPANLPARIASELRRKGLWTVEDIAQNVANTRNAFIVALGLTPATLTRLAEERK